MSELLFILASLLNDHYCQFLPQNDLLIPSTHKNTGLSEEEYHQVINKVEAIYSPVAKQFGANLVINRLWESPVVNAGTYRDGRNWVVNLYGGYPRHRETTADGYALVICHELGHHLGGAPKKYLGQNFPHWAGTEGQSDYFATLKCLRRVFRYDNNEEIVSKLEVPEHVKDKCTSAFPTFWERALCMRTSMAGISVANVSASTFNKPYPDILTPDKSEVEFTYEGHPEAQCRLDTYFQGSICEVSSYQNVSQTNPVTSTCHPKLNHKEGLGPSCWFKH